MGYDKLLLIGLPPHGKLKRKKTRFLQAICWLPFMKITNMVFATGLRFVHLNLLLYLTTGFELQRTTETMKKQ